MHGSLGRAYRRRCCFAPRTYHIQSPHRPLRSTGLRQRPRGPTKRAAAALVRGFSRSFHKRRYAITDWRYTRPRAPALQPEPGGEAVIQLRWGAPASRVPPTASRRWPCRFSEQSPSRGSGSHRHLCGGTPHSTRQRRMLPFLEAIQRAFHPAAALPQHVRVDHRRGHVVVPQQLLDRPNVRPALKGVGGEAVPERVRAGALGDPRARYRRPNRLLGSSPRPGGAAGPPRSVGQWTGPGQEIRIASAIRAPRWGTCGPMPRADTPTRTPRANPPDGGAAPAPNAAATPESGFRASTV